MTSLLQKPSSSFSVLSGPASSWRRSWFLQKDKHFRSSKFLAACPSLSSFRISAHLENQSYAEKVSGKIRRLKRRKKHEGDRRDSMSVQAIIVLLSILLGRDNMSVHGVSCHEIRSSTCHHLAPVQEQELSSYWPDPALFCAAIGHKLLNNLLASFVPLKENWKEGETGFSTKLKSKI